MLNNIINNIINKLNIFLLDLQKKETYTFNINLSNNSELIQENYLDKSLDYFLETKQDSKIDNNENINNFLVSKSSQVGETLLNSNFLHKFHIIDKKINIINTFIHSGIDSPYNIQFSSVILFCMSFIIIKKKGFWK